MTSRFRLICADPPWSFADSLTMSEVSRGASSHYPTLTINALCELPVERLAEDVAVLGLWVPSSMLSDGIRVMESWGFRQKQSWIWVKTAPATGWRGVRDLLASLALETALARLVLRLLRKSGLVPVFTDGSGLAFGMGRLGRNCHEVLLIGTRGKGVSKLVGSKSERTVFFAPAMPHSKKPEVAQDMLERLIPEGDRLELFARRERPNWLCIGNQSPLTPGVDIRDWIAARLAPRVG